MANYMKVASIVGPLTLSSTGFLYLYDRRKEYIADSVFQRGLLHLKRDTLITDFCGDKVEPGWMITREKKPGENWVKYSF